MTKKILVLGCSHVSGHGFEDAVKGDRHSVHAWPAKISKDFDVEVINYSSPGQNATYCVEKLQKYPNKQSLSAIILLFPFRSRMMMSRKLPNGEVEDVPYNLYSINDHRWDSVMNQYQKICHNWRVNDINFIAYYTYFQCISSTYNIPLWIACTTKEDHDLLSENNLELSMSMDWFQWCQENDFPKLPDTHYGHEAHEQFYLQYIKPWLQEKVFASVA